MSSYLSVARRWWLLIVAATVAAALGGSLLASQQPTIYESEARMLVGPFSTDLSTQRASGQLALTYSDIVTSRWLIHSTVARFGLQVDPADVQGNVSASANDVTRLLSVRVTDTDPERAAEVANALAQQLAILGAEGAREEGRIQIVETAQASSRPVAPQTSMITILAAFVGLLGAASLAILIEYFRGTVRSSEEMRAIVGAPVLATVPTGYRWLDLASGRFDGRATDAYRALSTKLEATRDAKATRVLLVVGVTPRARAGVVATLLALAYRTRGVTCALVDGDALNAEASELMGVDREPRLAEMIDAGRLPLKERQFVSSTRANRVRSAVALNVIPTAAGEPISTRVQIDTMLSTLRRTNEVVIIAVPPFTHSADALLWAQSADAALVVVPIDGASRNDLSSTIEAAQGLRLAALGIVLSDSRRFSPHALRNLAARYRPRQHAYASALGSRMLELGAPGRRRSAPGRETTDG